MGFPLCLADDCCCLLLFSSLTVILTVSFLGPSAPACKCLKDFLWCACVVPFHPSSLRSRSSWDFRAVSLCLLGGWVLCLRKSLPAPLSQLQASLPGHPSGDGMLNAGRCGAVPQTHLCWWRGRVEEMGLKPSWICDGVHTWAWTFAWEAVLAQRASGHTWFFQWGVWGESFYFLKD